MTMDNLAALLGTREEELSAIYENVPGIVFYIAVEPDGEFRFLSVSRDFLTVTGLNREQVVGSLVRDIIPQPSRDMVLNRYQEAIRSGQPVRWEEKSVYPAGQRYGEVAVTPLYDASGVATHLIGIVHDITERKRLEERCAEDLLEAAPDAMVVVNQAGRMILINRQTEILFGYQREEILGRSVEFLIPRRFHERHQAHRITFFFQPRIRPMGANLQLSGLRKDGTEFPVEISFSPIQTSEGILVTSAIRDISERKMAEDSRLKLATIVESSDDAIASGTLDGIIASWNRGAERIYGYTEAEAVGKPIMMLVPPDLPDEENKILEMLRAGRSIEHFETVRVTKNGKRINVSLSISPIKDSTGTTVGCCGIARDITERKEAEQALSEMTRKLIQAQEQERSRIGRELHDDISQRLAMLLLELERLGETPADIQSRTRELRKELHQISDDVQALSHDLHSSKMEYLGAVAGMRSWCKEFGERQEMEVDFRSDVPGPLPRELGLNLFRVLQEALQNVVKHSAATRVVVQIREDSGEIRLDISDSGRGFDVAAALEGNGLGLTSMRERIRLVNGTIAIDSKPMAGTTIRVRVPFRSGRGVQQGTG